MILITQSALLAESADYPFTHARIGYQTITRTGTLTASTAAALHPAYAAGLPNTYESWLGTAVPSWLQCDNGSPADVDYCAIAAHNLGTLGNTFKFQHSADGSTWTDATPELTVPDNTPIMVFFGEASARYWRLQILTGASPKIGVWYAGKSLAMQTGIESGYSPINLSRNTTVRSNKSEGGQFLGRYIVREGVSGKIDFIDLSDDWYREYFDPFVLSARANTFFLAWNPAYRPSDVVYGWTQGDISPTYTDPTGLISVSMNIQGAGNIQ